MVGDSSIHVNVIRLKELPRPLNLIATGIVKRKARDQLFGGTGLLTWKMTALSWME